MEAHLRLKLGPQNSLTDVAASNSGVLSVPDNQKNRPEESNTLTIRESGNDSYNVHPNITSVKSRKNSLMPPKISEAEDDDGFDYSARRNTQTYGRRASFLPNPKAKYTMEELNSTMHAISLDKRGSNIDSHIEAATFQSNKAFSGRANEYFSIKEAEAALQANFEELAAIEANKNQNDRESSVNDAVQTDVMKSFTKNVPGIRSRRASLLINKRPSIDTSAVDKMWGVDDESEFTAFTVTNDVQDGDYTDDSQSRRGSTFESNGATDNISSSNPLMYFQALQSTAMKTDIQRTLRFRRLSKQMVDDFRKGSISENTPRLQTITMIEESQREIDDMILAHKLKTIPFVEASTQIEPGDLTSLDTIDGIYLAFRDVIITIFFGTFNINSKSTGFL